MTEIAELSTVGVINEVHKITMERIEMQSELEELQWELAVSDLVSRIDHIEVQLKRMNDNEIEVRNKGIETMQALWLESFKAEGVEVRVKTSPGKLVVTDDKLIPEEYIREVTKVTKTVDKKGLKDAMKEGEIFDGCTLEQNITLEIKQL